MKCDICDMPAVINDLCQGCYDDLATGGDDALRAAEMFQLRIAERDKRIAELEADIESVAAEAAHTISGLAKRIAELEAQLASVLATIDRATKTDGVMYAEGCKP